MATESPESVWQYEADQYCDDTRFVNGTLGSKRVGIVGLGQIGRRVASWCNAMGAEVLGYDPFLPAAIAREHGAEATDLDRIVDEVDILFITVPPTPSAKNIVSRERVRRLRNGAIVVVVTRAHGIDMGALRERIHADEIMGAFDVYDVEPIPAGDPLRNRDNVIHLPHIAGRTRDSNVEAIDVIVDDFVRLLRGEAPVARVTREMVDIRLHRKDVPEE
jgi:D-3-phosphoglycerate dehydrogenase